MKELFEVCLETCYYSGLGLKHEEFNVSSHESFYDASRKMKELFNDITANKGGHAFIQNEVMFLAEKEDITWVCRMRLLTK